MTLRRRIAIAALVAAVLTALLALLVFARILVGSSPDAAREAALNPAVDSANALLLQQAGADLALNAYIELERPASLDEYRQALGRATTMLDELSSALDGQSQELVDLVSTARSAQRGWVKADADPAISLMEAGKRPRAMRETNSSEANAAFDAMTTAATTLHDAINAEREQAAAAVAGAIRGLLIVTVLAVLLVAVAIGALFYGLRAWIVEPLERVGAQVRRATDEPRHASPIVPEGPPEIRALALDAEMMRRELVREIDAAVAAREGLVQDAPLVAAMRAEIVGEPVDPDTRLAISGSSQSAEGVVSGDWWDSLVQPSGALAVVVADVSGHGPEASVVALRIRAVLRTALAAGMAPDDAMQMASLASAEGSRVITAVVIVVDPEAGIVRWCNAGHHPAILVTRDKESTLCEPTGPLLSSLGGSWTSQERPFGPGDVVVAFTDGLIEARNAEGDELESSAVAQLIRGMDAPVRENPGELIERLLAQVRHRAADWRRDDVTVVAISRRT